MQDSEIFIFNASEKEFEVLELKTKRIGGNAFSFRGNQFPETRRLFSVFAQRSELRELGIDYKLPDKIKV